MSLQEYKRKRNFRKTREPAGKRPAKSPTGRQFVVQKHDASRLHYDFRLEHEGTLKSWAVPKGPNLDPAVKSLAVQVEDHPLEYATFEGIIPAGQYGGGTVMVWDQGTWEPEEDVDRGFRDGKLKFKLHGQKLKGSWALVRMTGNSGDGGKNWLLIKHRDNAARPTANSDFLARHARSIVSGRTLVEIAADADNVWSKNGKASSAGPKKTTTNKRNAAKSRSGSKKSVVPDVPKLLGARRGALPKKFKPQLATLATEIPTGDQWLHELKFDGYRMLAFFGEGRVNLVTRNGNDCTRRFDPIVDALSKLSLDSSILDGEIVSLEETGRSNFQQLQNLLKRGNSSSLVYYLFDAPFLNGINLTDTPLEARKEALAQILRAHSPKNDGILRYSDHIVGQGDQVFEQACRGSMEGVVSKRADSTYQQFRSSAWLKVKCLKRQEFVIGGFTKAAGARVGFGALLLGYHQDGHLQYAGRVGTGFTSQSLRDLTQELKKRRADAPPFHDPPKGGARRGVTWVNPQLVAEVEFTEWTDDGHLRHPSFQGLREDKLPREIVREDVDTPVVENPDANGKLRSAHGRSKPAPKGAKGSPGNLGRANIKKKIEASIAGVHITHPDRVVYPHAGITKLEVAAYYESIADLVLPYITDRPLTLVRCPDGQAGQCFFQKHLTSALPDAVRGIMIQEKKKREEYLVIQDLAGLVSLVQMGVLEIHPWPARADNPERPDYLVMDLDPGDGATWKQVVDGARELRQRFTQLGLQSFLRTSGGKGLHVCVPIIRRTNWNDFKAFAKALAEAMVRDAPTRYIATMSKAKRRGKVLIDYFRNQRGATAIASYSTRARPGAPIATPIAWDELTSHLKPNRYTIKNLPKRLSLLKFDPWQDFFATKQAITAKMMKALE